MGTKVTGGHQFEGTNFDKLLLIYSNGTYQVINIPEKHYINPKGSQVIYVGIADKKTVISLAYKDLKSRQWFAKRFVVDKFILDKIYRYVEEGVELHYFTTEPEVTLEMQFVPKPKQKTGKGMFSFEGVDQRDFGKRNKNVAA